MSHTPRPQRRRLPAGAPPGPASSERQRLIEDAYRKAASDPEFVREMAEIAEAFDPTVGDGLSGED